MVAGSDQRKYLILGSTGYPRGVEAFGWHELPPDLNVADYDTVILDLTTADRSLEYAEFQRLPRVDQFARLIFSGGSAVIAVGDPTRSFEAEPNFMPVTWWLPIELRVIQDHGDIREHDEEFAAYFSRTTKRYGWLLEHMPHAFVRPSYPLDPVSAGADLINVSTTRLAQTRFGKAVAFTLKLSAVRSSSPGSTIARSGTVIWLPGPTEVDSRDAVSLLLQQFFGIAQVHEPPDWTREFRLPNEKEPREAITAIERQLTKLASDRAEAVARLASERSPARLLYESGPELEEAVRDVLRRLEAQVDDPTDPAHEDGRLTDPRGRRGMLEIKGRKGTLRLADVRELDQWVRDRLLEWESKGLLIANLGLERRPAEREAIFPPNCVALAERTGIALVTTAQILQALAELQRGRLDQEAFFDALFETSGVADLPELD